jgi:hypothetical protein
LGFLIHERGIDVGQKSISAIDKLEARTNKKKLQSLVSKINFIRRFISNLSKRIQPFTPLLKLKADQKFVWGEEQHKALNNIKQYYKSPSVLMPPQDKKSVKLYLSANEQAIRSALVQEFEGKERVIYFISRRLLDAETRYSAVKRLCLCLYFSCTKLRPYLLTVECIVVCKDDIVKYMLSLPILKGRIGKWILALPKFDFTYQSAKEIKGQLMVDNLVERELGLELFLFHLKEKIMSFPSQLRKLRQTIRLNIRQY